MAFDKLTAMWSASINGTPLYAGPVDDTNLKTFRIATTTGSTTTTSAAVRR